MDDENGLSPLRELGPFFAVDTHDGDHPGGSWRPITQTLHDPDALGRRVEHLREYLAAGSGRSPADVQPRVAASVMHLGLVARLVSPWLGLAGLGRGLVVVRLADLWWVPATGSSFPLSVATAGIQRDRHGDAPSWAAAVVEHLLAPLAAAVPGSPRVLWGNTASAINGAVTAVGATRPDLLPSMRALAEALLRALPVDRLHTGQVGTSSFRRRSCCLLYRVAGGAPHPVCGDCVLAGPPA